MAAHARIEPHSLAARHAWYRSLRSSDPVPNDDGVWQVARYRDVITAARDSGRFSSWFGNDRRNVHIDALPSLDPPEHTQIRRSVRAPFSPRASTLFEPIVDDVVLQAFEQISSSRRTVDGIRSFASRIPVAVLSRILGMKRHVVSAAVEHGGRLRWSIIGRELQTWVSSEPEELPPVPRHLTREMRAGGLSEADVHSFVVLLTIAGIDTVRDMLGELLLLLAMEPRLIAELGARRSTAGSVSEELLRWLSPIQAVYRTTADECQLGTTMIPAGSKVMLIVGAANRDESVWPTAADLDLDRYARRRGRRDERPADHLAFGAGGHRCLGAALAQDQIEAVVRHLPHCIAELELAGRAVQRPSSMVQGLQTLPLRVSAA